MIGRRLGEYLFKKGRKTLQARLGVINVRARERKGRQHGLRPLRLLFDPDTLAALLHREQKFLTVEYDVCSPVSR